MLEKNISLVKLSQLTGIEKGNLSTIVNGKGNPTLKTLIAIANALDANITEFFEKAEPTMKVMFTCPCCGKMYDISITEHQQTSKPSVGERQSEEKLP